MKVGIHEARELINERFYNTPEVISPNWKQAAKKEKGLLGHTLLSLLQSTHFLTSSLRTFKDSPSSEENRKSLQMAVASCSSFIGTYPLNNSTYIGVKSMRKDL